MTSEDQSQGERVVRECLEQARRDFGVVNDFLTSLLTSCEGLIGAYVLLFAAALLAWKRLHGGVGRIDMSYSQREIDYIWNLEESRLSSQPRCPCFGPLPTRSELFRQLHYLLNEVLAGQKESDVLVDIITRMSRNLTDAGIEPPQSSLFPVGFTQIEEYHIDLGEEAPT